MLLCFNSQGIARAPDVQYNNSVGGASYFVTLPFYKHPPTRITQSMFPSLPSLAEIPSSSTKHLSQPVFLAKSRIRKLIRELMWNVLLTIRRGFWLKFMPFYSCFLWFLSYLHTYWVQLLWEERASDSLGMAVNRIAPEEAKWQVEEPFSVCTACTWIPVFVVIMYTSNYGTLHVVGEQLLSDLKKANSYDPKQAWFINMGFEQGSLVAIWPKNRHSDSVLLVCFGAGYVFILDPSASFITKLC